MDHSVAVGLTTLAGISLAVGGLYVSEVFSARREQRYAKAAHQVHEFLDELDHAGSLVRVHPSHIWDMVLSRDQAYYRSFRSKQHDLVLKFLGQVNFDIALDDWLHNLYFQPRFPERVEERGRELGAHTFSLSYKPLENNVIPVSVGYHCSPTGQLSPL